MITEQFLKNSYTKRGALKDFQIVKEFLNFKLFENSQNLLFNELAEKFSLKNTNTQELINGLGEDFFNSFTAMNLAKDLKLIEDQINSAKTIILYVPFDLPDQEIEKLGRWFKDNLGEDTLFEIHFDSSLIGGCAISYKGIYKDYSLKSKISQNREKILSVLSKYVT